MIAPQFITFTGLDARTNLAHASKLARKYPVEFAVLFSQSKQGIDQRYPSKEVIVSTLMSTIPQVAAHLCGEYSRSIMQGSEIDYDTPHLSCFGRVQVNHQNPDAQMISRFGDRFRVRCIAQARDLEFPSDARVDWLYDRSGGTGETQVEWPRHPGGNRLVGYAGGINPNNVADILEKIGSDGPYYIDMETGVRTENWLDLDKCEAVCLTVYGRHFQRSA